MYLHEWSVVAALSKLYSTIYICEEVKKMHLKTVKSVLCANCLCPLENICTMHY